VMREWQRLQRGLPCGVHVLAYADRCAPRCRPGCARGRARGAPRFLPSCVFLWLRPLRPPARPPAQRLSSLPSLARSLPPSVPCSPVAVLPACLPARLWSRSRPPSRAQYGAAPRGRRRPCRHALRRLPFRVRSRAASGLPGLATAAPLPLARRPAQPEPLRGRQGAGRRQGWLAGWPSAGWLALLRGSSARLTHWLACVYSSLTHVLTHSRAHSLED
jgi:hypothetical protein